MWSDVVGLDASCPFFSFYGFAKQRSLRPDDFEHANSKKILKFLFIHFRYLFSFSHWEKKIDRQMGFPFSVSYMTSVHKDFTASRVFFVSTATELACCRILKVAMYYIHIAGFLKRAGYFHFVCANLYIVENKIFLLSPKFLV